MAREPFDSDEAAFSPSWPQAVMLKNEVFSCHSPFCW